MVQHASSLRSRRQSARSHRRSATVSTLVGVGYHKVHAQHRLGVFGVQAGVAAGDHQLGRGIFAVGAADQMLGFAHGIVGDRAGIEHNQIGIGGLMHDAMAFRLELPRPGFQFGFVEAAA